MLRNNPSIQNIVNKEWYDVSNMCNLPKMSSIASFAMMQQFFMGYERRIEQRNGEMTMKIYLHIVFKNSIQLFMVNWILRMKRSTLIRPN